MNFKVTSSKIVFEGRVFNVRYDEIEYTSGNKGIREVALHNGGAVIVAVKQNRILMVKQYRYPFDEYLFELPAGKLELNEDPIHCAGRELEEETGYICDNLIKLGTICTTPGFCSEKLHIYLAENLSEGKLAREEGEYGMELYEFSLQEILQMIDNGTIKDAKTICGINYYLIKKNLVKNIL